MLSFHQDPDASPPSCSIDPTFHLDDKMRTEGGSLGKREKQAHHSPHSEAEAQGGAAGSGQAPPN